MCDLWQDCRRVVAYSVLVAVVTLCGCSTSETDPRRTGTGSGGQGSAVASGGDGSGGNGGAGGGEAVVAVTGDGAGGADGAVGDEGADDGSCGSDSVAGVELCDNGLDDNLNGFIDEGCLCSGGMTQPCFGGDPADAGRCTLGTQRCESDNELGAWGPCEGWRCGQIPPVTEQCDNGLDEDCDGRVDEGCLLDVPVNIDGDCLEAACPPQAPFPVGCNIIMSGGDSRGCVASTPANSTVYFQEGDACPLGLPFEDAGHVGGMLLCSTRQGEPLDDSSCPINKPDPSYPPNRGGCAPPN